MALNGLLAPVRVIGALAAVCAANAVSAGTSDPQFVVPLLECIEGDRERYVAHFGFHNRWWETVAAPITAENNIFIGGGVSPNVGQPAHFVPGRHHFVFSAQFDAAEAPQYAWVLGAYIQYFSLESPSCTFAGLPQVAAFAECASVDPLTGQGIARFGYYNSTDTALGYRLPHTYNRMGSAPITHASAFRGQPGVLRPGLQSHAFTTQFDPQRESGVIWRLEHDVAFAAVGLPGLPVCDTGTRIDVSGSAQSALPGTGFAQPLRLRLLSASGEPLPGRSVQWSGRGGMSGPDAQFEVIDAVTDANGEASALATANGVLGRYTLVAWVPDERISASWYLENVDVLPPAPTVFADSFEQRD